MVTASCCSAVAFRKWQLLKQISVNHIHNYLLINWTTTVHQHLTLINCRAYNCLCKVQWWICCCLSLFKSKERENMLQLKKMGWHVFRIIHRKIFLYISVLLIALFAQADLIMTVCTQIFLLSEMLDQAYVNINKISS